MVIKSHLKYVSNEVFQELKLGIFCLNKDKYITSSEVVEKVKTAIPVGVTDKHKLKVGHGGTLDSSATGVLVIGLGRGCKLLTNFLHGNKVYIVRGKLGAATDTYNAEGKLTHIQKLCNVNETKFMSSLEKYRGEILQTPPPYCALKRNGQRISDLVRTGTNVTLNPRRVQCWHIDCLQYNPPYFELRVSCGGGFYIRSLVHDIGLDLGCYAHVVDLKREKQEPFTIEDCLSLNELKYENILKGVSDIKNKYFI